MLGENSLNAVICFPTEDESLSTGAAHVLGYALGDGHHLVQRIEVSSDEGKTWSRAAFLTESSDLWAWRLWEAEVSVQPWTTHIVARATDTAGNTQPEDTQEIWNFKGYANNAWHRVKVQVT